MGESVIRREPSLNAVSADSRLQALLLWHEIDAFNARYAAALDEQRLSEWTEMFTDDALYVILSRENFDRGLPVGLIYCENKAMIHDRAFALMETSMFAPRYLRHIIGNQAVLSEEPDGTIKSRAKYRELAEISPGNTNPGKLASAMLCARPMPDSNIPPHQTGIPFE